MRWLVLVTALVVAVWQTPSGRAGTCVDALRGRFGQERDRVVEAERQVAEAEARVTAREESLAAKVAAKEVAEAAGAAPEAVEKLGALAEAAEAELGAAQEALQEARDAVEDAGAPAQDLMAFVKALHLESAAEREAASCRKLGSLVSGDYGDAMLAPRPAHAIGRAPGWMLAPSVRPTQPGAQGSLAQGGAAPSLHTVALAGGTVALGGGASDSQAVVAVSLNPAGLATLDSEDFGASSRAVDLSLLLPLDLDALGSGKGDDAFQYMGVRVRANVIGMLADPEELATAARQADEVFTRALAAEGAADQALAAVFAAAPDPQACYEAYAAGVDSERGAGLQGAVDAACGRRIEFAELAAASAELRQKLHDWRREADEMYAGLDLRLDLGDPDGGGLVGWGISALGAAGGFAYRSEHHAIQWGANLGLDYRSIRRSQRPRDAAGEETQAAFLSLQGALALSYGFQLDALDASMSIGLEGRYSPGEDDVPDLGGNYLDFKLGVEVPVIDDQTIGVALSVPLAHEQPREVTASFSFDWSLLSVLAESLTGK